MQILYVAIGGGLGAVARYLMSEYVGRLHSTPMPWGTFFVNISGAVLIGILFVLISEKDVLHADLKFLLMTGVLGGFTTYSAFSLESFRLLENGQILLASGYMLGTTLVCLLGVWLGVITTRSLL